MSESTGGMLEGKAVLVVGASAGIGSDAARLFAREGARLVLAARTREPLRLIEAEIAEAGGEAVAVTGDVALAADAERFTATAVERYGRLDGAFNNAGMNQYGRLDDVSEEEFDRIMAVNVKGTWLCLRAQLRAMRLTGGGSIVNTSSIGGIRGSTGLGAYQATKHAVIGMTRTAAHDNGPDGIRVNAIAPGPTETPMLAKWRGDDPDAVARRVAAVPLRRPSLASEVAEAAAWLLSDRASAITGVVLPVDGGYSA